MFGITGLLESKLLLYLQGLRVVTTINHKPVRKIHTFYDFVLD